MKKLLGIVVLGLLWCSTTDAKEKIKFKGIVETSPKHIILKFKANSDGMKKLSTEIPNEAVQHCASHNKNVYHFAHKGRSDYRGGFNPDAYYHKGINYRYICANTPKRAINVLLAGGLGLKEINGKFNLLRYEDKYFKPSVNNITAKKENFPEHLKAEKDEEKQKKIKLAKQKEERKKAEEEKKLAEEKKDKEDKERLEDQKITQQEAIDKYLSGKDLESIEGIWMLNNRISAFYKEGDKIICKIIRSTILESGEEYCSLTKGSSKVYYGDYIKGKDRKSSQVTVRLWYESMDNEIKEIIDRATFDLAGTSTNISYKKLWPEVASSGSSKSENKKVSSSGSAFFINKKGNFITNYHVIKGCNDKSKIMYKNKEYSARLIATDKKLDLAVLKADVKNKEYLDFSYDVKKLQKIYVAGYPFGKHLSDDLKFSDGIISSLKGFEDNTNQIQISAPINQGNSGGPVVNQSGELVGVAVSGLAKDLTEGINFAIKSEAVQTFLKANKIKPSTSYYSRELKNDKLLELLEESSLYTFCY